MLVLYVALGGALGSVARYLLMSLVGHVTSKEFPYATLAVNIFGSFLLGATVGAIAALLPARSREIHALVAIGMLGGFTTFSTFAMDASLLMEEGRFAASLAYVLASVLLSVLAFFCGLWLLRQVA